MPHYPEAVLPRPRGLWYVQIDGRQINLGPDRDEAFRRYHDLMARGRDQPEPSTGDSVVSVLDAFLDWCQKHQRRADLRLVPRLPPVVRPLDPSRPAGRAS